MTELCIRIYRYFRSHRTQFWCLMVCLFMVCGYFSSQIHLEEDLNKLMPSSRNEDGSMKLAFANLRIKDKTFLLFEGKKGVGTERIAEVCDAFVDSLQARDVRGDSTQRAVGDVFYRLSDDLIPDGIAYPFHRKKPLLVVICLTMSLCIGCFAIKGTQFDADMHSLGYKSPNTTYSENLLREKTYTGDKSKYFAASGKTMEEALENFSLLEHKLDSLKRIGLVKSYTHTDKIFVPLKVQQQRIIAWKRYWTPERLGRVRNLIAETAPMAGMRPEAFDAFYDYATKDYQPSALYRAGIIPEGYLSTLMEQSYNGEYLCFASVRCANDTVHSKSSDHVLRIHGSAG